jgi:anti-sigma regulatory factor (Ser/Thr protein kinase)
VTDQVAKKRAATTISTIHDIEQYHWQLQESEVHRHSFSNNNSLSLPAAVELACIEHHFAGAGDRNAASVRLPQCPTWQLIREAKWPMRRKPAKLRNGNVAIALLPTNSNDPWWISQLHAIQKELGENGFGINLARALTSAVAEMVDNVWIHSSINLPGLLGYQIHRRKFAFCVADMGIGVLTSLKRNSRYRHLASSMDALELAITPGASALKDGSGLGFPTLLHCLAELWGHVRFRSGEAVMTIDRSSEHRTKNFHYAPSLPGLHVAVRCSLDPRP